MVEEGKPAPDIELTTDSGERVKLSDFRGQPVVLYFYPKDPARASKYSVAWCLSPERSRST
jgi:peroxiredoxin